VDAGASHVTLQEASLDASDPTRALEFYMFALFSASRPARVVASLAIAGGLTLGLSACSQVTTDIYYAPSDGTRVTLPTNTLEVINLMILTSDNGNAVLVGAIHNRTTESNTATITATDGSIDKSFTVDGGATLNLYKDGEPVTLTGFTAKAGSAVEATFSDAQGTSQTIHIPVFDGDLPEYQEYLPTAAQ